MAKTRKFVAYRRLERPYTRKSKYRAKSYVKANPTNRIVRYDMGDTKGDYYYRLNLVSETDLQIRDLALESARLACNRVLERKLGKMTYHFKINLYPHHVLRENPLAAGAGADRMSTGMKHSFGKVIGIAAQVKKGKKLLTVWVKKSDLNTAKLSLKRAKNKLPNSWKIIVNEIEKKKK